MDENTKITALFDCITPKIVLGETLVSFSESIVEDYRTSNNLTEHETRRILARIAYIYMKKKFRSSIYNKSTQIATCNTFSYDVKDDAVVLVLEKDSFGNYALLDSHIASEYIWYIQERKRHISSSLDIRTIPLVLYIVTPHELPTKEKHGFTLCHYLCKGGIKFDDIKTLSRKKVETVLKDAYKLLCGFKLPLKKLVQSLLHDADPFSKEKEVYEMIQDMSPVLSLKVNTPEHLTERNTSVTTTTASVNTQKRPEIETIYCEEDMSLFYYEEDANGDPIQTNTSITSATIDEDQEYNVTEIRGSMELAMEPQKTLRPPSRSSSSNKTQTRVIPPVIPLCTYFPFVDIVSVSNTAKLEPLDIQKLILSRYFILVHALKMEKRENKEEKLLEQLLNTSNIMSVFSLEDTTSFLLMIQILCLDFKEDKIEETHMMDWMFRACHQYTYWSTRKMFPDDSSMVKACNTGRIPGLHHVQIVDERLKAELSKHNGGKDYFGSYKSEELFYVNVIDCINVANTTKMLYIEDGKCYMRRNHVISTYITSLARNLIQSIVSSIKLNFHEKEKMLHSANTPTFLSIAREPIMEHCETNFLSKGSKAENLLKMNPIREKNPAVFKQMKLLPLCMYEMIERLEKRVHMKYYLREALVRYMTDCGITKKDFMGYVTKFLTGGKLLDDIPKYEHHMDRKQRGMWEFPCEKMIYSPKAGDQFKCPYTYLDTATRSLLQRYGGINETDIEDIMVHAKNSDPLSACMLHLKSIKSNFEPDDYELGGDPRSEINRSEYRPHVFTYHRTKRVSKSKSIPHRTIQYQDV